MKLQQQSFQTETPVYVKRAFTANARKFERGQEFPWKELGITPEKVNQLFRVGKVHHRVVTKPAKVRPAPVTAAPEPVAQVGDDLDAIDDMKQLRAIADEIGAPYKVSKADQRQAIREARG